MSEIGALPEEIRNNHVSVFNNNHVITRDGEKHSPVTLIGDLFCLKMDSFLIIPKEKMTKEDLTKLGYSHLFQ